MKRIASNRRKLALLVILKKRFKNLATPNESQPSEPDLELVNEFGALIGGR